MRKANRKLKKPTFPKEIGLFLIFFFIKYKGTETFFFEKLFHVRLKCRLLVRK